jgi:hypothetical protein
MLYNWRMAAPTEQVFRPDVLSRRNEIIAWGVFIAAALGTVIFRNYQTLPNWIYIGVGLLFVLAAGLSLGNWMDRRTVLQLSSEGLEFKNGLRHVRMGWRDIQSMEVLPSNMGKGVRVTGPKGHFSFTVSGGLRLGGKTQGRFGFPDGDAIIKEIVRRSGLPLASHSGGRFYYARS